MSTHPIMPLYVDDFEAATAHLSPEEDGIYNRLMRLCWRTPGCSLPNDPDWIARKIRLTPEEFARVAAPVIAEFFSVKRGRVVQGRLKAEYDDITRKISARKQAGKRGGEAKAAKTKVKSPSIATDLPGDTRAFPYPDPDIEQQRLAQPAAPIGLDGLEVRLRRAGGQAIADPARCPGLLDLSSILRLINPDGSAPPCSLDMDVIPAIAARCATAKAGSIRAWAYFENGILEARNRRLSGPPQIESPHERPRQPSDKLAAKHANLAAAERGAASAIARFDEQF